MPIPASVVSDGATGRSGPVPAQTVVMVVIAMLEGVVIYTLAARGGFWLDDFLNLGVARDQARLGRAYLMSPIFGHLAPGPRAAYYLISRFSPPNYDAALLVLVCMHVLSIVVLYRLLRLISTPGWGQVVIASGFGLSALWVSSLLWFPGAIELVPSTLLGIICLDSGVRHLLTRRPIHLAASVSAFAASLLFYEKAALYLIYLVAVAMLILGRDLPLRSVPALVLRHWRTWTPHLIVAAGYVAVYLAGGYGGRAPQSRPADLLGYAALAWVQGLTPAMLGGPLGWTWIGIHGIADPPLWQMVVDQLVLLGLILWGLRRDRSGWRAWAFLGIAFLLSVAPVGHSRLAIFGPGIARELRYVTDLTPIVAITFALTLLGPPRASARPGAAGSAPTPGRRRALRLAVGAASVGAYALVVTASTGPISDRWAHNTDTAFLRNAQAGIEALAAGGNTGSVYDGTVSAEMVPAEWYPYNRYSVLMRLLPLQPVFNRAMPRMYTLTAAGRVVPARWRPAGGLRMLPACVEGGRILLAPLTNSLEAKPWLIRVQYRADGPATLHIAADPGDGTPAGSNGTSTTAALSTGEGVYITDMRPSPVAGLQLLVDPGQRVCLSAVEVGTDVEAP